MSEMNLRDDFKNPWFLGILALVAAALAATIWMALIAGATSPGLVSEDYYDRGKNHFNEMPKQQEAQWRLSLMAPEKPAVGKSQLYRFYAVTSDGKPVNNGVVTLQAYRPSDANADFNVTMRRSDTGTFTALIAFPLPGTWDLIAQIEFGGQKYDVTQRLFVGD